jgi:3-oxoacyl-[acyl-carrier protein] reductase
MDKNYIFDKNIWLTGASSGIGLEIAKSLAEFNTNLILSSKNIDKLTKAAATISGKAKVYAFPMDVSSTISIMDTFEFLSHEVGFPDILINNAGIYESKSFLDLTTVDFDKVINTNLRSAFDTTQCVLPAMLEAGGGTVINIISITALQPFKHTSIYAASKAALLAMMQCIREEVRKSNIKIINIIPGATATSIWSDDILTSKQNIMSSPKDIADVVIATLKLCDSNTSMLEDIIIRPQMGDF